MEHQQQRATLGALSARVRTLLRLPFSFRHRVPFPFTDRVARFRRRPRTAEACAVEMCRECHRHSPPSLPAINASPLLLVASPPETSRRLPAQPGCAPAPACHAPSPGKATGGALRGHVGSRWRRVTHALFLSLSVSLARAQTTALAFDGSAAGSIGVPSQFQPGALETMRATQVIKKMARLWRVRRFLAMHEHLATEAR